jgi:hypothetical protein
MNSLDTSLVIALVAQTALKKLMDLAGKDEFTLPKNMPKGYTLDVSLNEDGQKVIIRLVNTPPEGATSSDSEEVPCETLILDLLGNAVAELMHQLNLEQLEIPLQELQAAMESPAVAAGVFVPKAAATLHVKKLS